MKKLSQSKDWTFDDLQDYYEEIEKIYKTEKYATIAAYKQKN